MPNKNNVPKIPIPNKIVIIISIENNWLFNLSIFLFVILINSETFTFYHLLENDVEVALIAANVKVKMKINTATFSNPILTLNIIFKKNFPTANNLFVFVITSTPFLKFSINQLNIFCLPDSKIEQNKSRRFYNRRNLTPMKAGYSLAHVRSWQILQCFWLTSSLYSWLL